MRSKLFLSVFLFSITILSCDKTDENINVNSDNSKNYESKSTIKFTDVEVKEFKEIVLSSELPKLVSSWEGYLKNREDVNVLLTRDKIIDEVKIVESKFKGNIIEIIDYIGQIETYGSHDGSACTRNLDSTVYLGTCTFWGRLAVGVKGGMTCDRPSGSYYMSLSPSERESAIDDYYDCMQEVVCKTC